MINQMKFAILPNTQPKENCLGPFSGMQVQLQDEEEKKQEL
jgi:hypothetical protein